MTGTCKSSGEAAPSRRSGWQPGQSGNPAGRKRGTGAVTKLRAKIAAQMPDIIAKMVEAAAAGDVQAARLLLERVIPPMRSTTQPINLPEFAGSLAERATAILDAVGRGDTPPDVGAQLVGAVGATARIYETEELERRITALENAK